MVSIQELKYQYPTGKSIRFPDFTATKGSPHLLLGESGSGKTTLLHLLGGLLRSQTGFIQVGEAPIHSLTESALDRFRGQHIGFIFQRNHLISALTVEENLLMAPFLAGHPQSKSRVSEVLDQLGISDKKNARIRELSQGQAQRVAIARAVMNKPSLILADEPTSALDDSSCQKVSQLLLQAAAQNESTLIIATHDHRLKTVISHQLKLDNA